MLAIVNLFQEKKLQKTNTDHKMLRNNLTPYQTQKTQYTSLENACSTFKEPKTMMALPKTQIYKLRKSL